MSNFRFENATPKISDSNERMSVISNDQATPTEIVATESSYTSEKSGILHINEGIKSGESKFKVFTFAPSANDAHDTQKSLDFWDFIEGWGELVPARAFKLTPLRTMTPKTDGEREETPDWTTVFEILKERGINSCSINADKCRICDYDKSIECICEDHFDPAELDGWDPFKKTYADAAVVTDYIVTQDATTQTTFREPEDIDRENREVLMDEIDAILRQLTVTCDCPLGKTCEESTSNLPEQIDSEYSFQRLDKGTCSCGRENCLCSEYYQVLDAISAANQEADDLKVCEVANCECSCLNLALIRNYKLLLECKIELQSVWGRKVNREVVCVCKQDKCPCSIVIRLHKEIDRIFGWGRDDNLETVYCTCKDYYESVLKKLSSDRKLKIESNLNISADEFNKSTSSGRIQLHKIEVEESYVQSLHLMTLHLNSPRESYVELGEMVKKSSSGVQFNLPNVGRAKGSGTVSYMGRKSVVQESYIIAKSKLEELNELYMKGCNFSDDALSCRCDNITPANSREDCLPELKNRKKAERKKQKTYAGRRKQSKSKVESKVEITGLVIRKLEKTGVNKLEDENKNKGKLQKDSKGNRVCTLRKCPESERCDCRKRNTKNYCPEDIKKVLGGKIEEMARIKKNARNYSVEKAKAFEESRNAIKKKNTEFDDLMIEGRAITIHMISEDDFASSIRREDTSCPGNLSGYCQGSKRDEVKSFEDLTPHKGGTKGSCPEDRGLCLGSKKKALEDTKKTLSITRSKQSPEHHVSKSKSSSEKFCPEEARSELGKVSLSNAKHYDIFSCGNCEKASLVDEAVDFHTLDSDEDDQDVFREHQKNGDLQAQTQPSKNEGVKTSGIIDLSPRTGCFKTRLRNSETTHTPSKKLFVSEGIPSNDGGTPSPKNSSLTNITPKIGSFKGKSSKGNCWKNPLLTNEDFCSGNEPNNLTCKNSDPLEIDDYNTPSIPTTILYKNSSSISENDLEGNNRSSTDDDTSSLRNHQQPSNDDADEKTTRTYLETKSQEIPSSQFDNSFMNVQRNHVNSKIRSRPATRRNLSDAAAAKEKVNSVTEYIEVSSVPAKTVETLNEHSPKIGKKTSSCNKTFDITPKLNRTENKISEDDKEVQSDVSIPPKVCDYNDFVTQEKTCEDHPSETSKANKSITIALLSLQPGTPDTTSTVEFTPKTTQKSNQQTHHKIKNVTKKRYPPPEEETAIKSNNDSILANKGGKMFCSNQELPLTGAEDGKRLSVITEESKKEMRRIQRNEGIVVSDTTTVVSDSANPKGTAVTT